MWKTPFQGRKATKEFFNEDEAYYLNSYIKILVKKVTVLFYYQLNVHGVRTKAKCETLYRYSGQTKVIRVDYMLDFLLYGIVKKKFKFLMLINEINYFEQWLVV